MSFPPDPPTGDTKLWGSPLVQVHLQDLSGQEAPRGQEDLCLQMHQVHPACQAHPERIQTRTMSVHAKHPCQDSTIPFRGYS